MTGAGQLLLAYAHFNPPGHRDLAAHLRYVERSARKLARSTSCAMARWQGRMETKQGFRGRIVDIGAELFAMSAACVRAERLRTEGAHGAEPYQLAEAFCHQSRIRVGELFGRLWTNTDDLDRKIVSEVLRGRTPGWRRASSTPVTTVPGSPTPHRGCRGGPTCIARSADAPSRHRSFNFAVSVETRCLWRHGRQRSYGPAPAVRCPSTQTMHSAPPACLAQLLGLPAYMLADDRASSCRSTEHGARSTEHGARSTEHGARSTEHGARSTECFRLTPCPPCPVAPSPRRPVVRPKFRASPPRAPFVSWVRSLPAMAESY
ncbi:hypothetical protein FHS42_003114 [Streptomyces zagrosensis]|uniref:Acyl-CoA dehydrogenase/oxidase C-terminal domain-containing protein n=1 Tax=Streptomyces zagrosensis TaxID=1042984 RepID=A0A7W9UYK2_9ACTN|nr:hypothetical protein [Streptomyces zagrosensis]